jgi:hypothetical protein
VVFGRGPFCYIRQFSTYKSSGNDGSFAFNHGLMANVFHSDRLRWVAERATTAILLLGAAVFLFMPRSVEVVTGVRPSPQLAAPDNLPPLSKDDAAPFFQTRNQVEIHVAQATTLREFLDRNRLNKPFQRKQVVDQLGNAAPDAPIAAGTVFRLTLTPVVVDVPGARPAPKGDPE